MLIKAYQRVATLQLGNNCCSFIVIFAALSSATLKSERAFKVCLYRTRPRLGGVLEGMV